MSVWLPNNPVSLEAAAREEVESFLAALDNNDDDDVQRLYVGLS